LFEIYEIPKGAHDMKTVTLAGLALLVLGILSLAYQGITYTTHKKVVDIGPIQATKDSPSTNSRRNRAGRRRGAADGRHEKK
jgi:hypothetical protein